MVFPKENEQQLPLYVLRPSESERAVFHFSKAGLRLAGKRKRLDGLKGFDSRIEDIELRLRSAVCVALQQDPKSLPPHVTEKIKQRIRDLAKKDASVDVRRFKLLSAMLEFCDLRELQDTILNPALWPRFKQRFVNQEGLKGRFGQLADLRNSIRHSRKVDDIMEKDGEAAILWFERVLSKTESADDVLGEEHPPLS